MEIQQVHIARRISQIKYAIRDLQAFAEKVKAKGMDIYELNIGDPGKASAGFHPPKQIKLGLIEAAKHDFTGYAPAQGDPMLRHIIAKRENVSPDRVFVCIGLSEGIDHLAMSLVNEGESILVPSPGYPLYSTVINALFAKAVFYKTDERFYPDLKDIEQKIDPTTQALVAINPNNPTSIIYPPTLLKKILDMAAERNLLVFTDEIYDLLGFKGEKPVNLHTLNPDATIIRGSGFSKNFIYPGMRIGYLVLHGEGTNTMQLPLTKLGNRRLAAGTWEHNLAAWVGLKVYDNEEKGLDLKTDLYEEYNEIKKTMDQSERDRYEKFIKSIVAALTEMMSGKEKYISMHEHLENFKRELAVRQNIVYQDLNGKNGINLVEPQAAFYAFPQIDVPAFKDDMQFALKLLETTGVFVVPGMGFSPILEGKYFRMVTLEKPERLHEANEKILSFIQDNG